MGGKINLQNIPVDEDHLALGLVEFDLQQIAAVVKESSALDLVTLLDPDRGLEILEIGIPVRHLVEDVHGIDQVLSGVLPEEHNLTDEKKKYKKGPFH